MYPLFLNMRNRLAVVVGGGEVGRRKARASSMPAPASGSSAWSPAPPTARLAGWNGSSSRTATRIWTERRWRSPRRRPPVNRAVIADAKRRGVWVNAAGEPEASDFVLPAMIRHGDFVLAVGTGGAAPNLAQRSPRTTRTGLR